MCFNITIYKCKVFKVYLKYTFISSTLAQSNTYNKNICIWH